MAIRDDILATLDIDRAERVVTGFNRPNLFFDVQSTPTANDKRRALKAFLDEHDGAGLIYVGTRKHCEDVTRFIRDEVGRDVRAYHAGLPDAERTEVLELLREDSINVSYSTINSAPFDMRMRGIDSLVRASVHAYNSEDEIDAFLTAMDVIAT